MLPVAVKQTLWSYDTDKINVDTDRKLIICQVLNFGTKEASDWVLNYYGKEVVKQVAQTLTFGQWDKKSLNYWSLVLDFDSNIIKNRFD